MNQRAPSLIHNLTFDIACAGAAGDGPAMADWIKEALLPVMEEVFDQLDRPGQVRRIVQLEIDLGTVSREESRSELARRLFAQLSGALGESIEDATDASLVEERERQSSAHLLDFLRTGMLEWSVAVDGRVAHRNLLQRVLESSRAAEVLRTAISDARMLARLLRQFDAADLNSVAQVLLRSWPERERAAPLAADAASAAVVAGDKAAYWRLLLQTCARPPAERKHREGLQELRRMLDRDALRQIWRQLQDDVRQRIGKRCISALSPEAMTDLALILRPRAQQLFAEHGGEWLPSQIDTVLQLLVAGDETIAAVTLMLAGPGEQLPAAPRQQLEVEERRQRSPQRRSEVVPAGIDAIAASRSMHASPNQAAADILSRRSRTFSRDQRVIFQPIRRRLAGQVASGTVGRDVPTPSATQKSDLALILRPHDPTLTRKLGRRDEAHRVEALVRLLPLADGGCIDVQAMFSKASDPRPAILTARLWGAFTIEQRAAFRRVWQFLSEEVANRTAGRVLATLTVEQRSDLALVLKTHAVALMKELGQQDETPPVEVVVQLLLASDDASIAVKAMSTSVSDSSPVGRTSARHEQSDAGMNHHLSSPEPQNHLSLLASAWEAFSPEQRSVLSHIWRRLSADAASRSPGRDLAPLPVAPKARLAMILKSPTDAPLKELEHQDETHSEIHHRVLPPDAQDRLALLTRLWGAFGIEQRAAFAPIGRRLSEEFAKRTAGRGVATLAAAQKSDLALILRTHVVALMKELGQRDQTTIVEAVVQLLLASDDAPVAVNAMFNSPSDWRRVSTENASRATDPGAATLPVVQKAGLALISKSRADALLKEVEHTGGRDLATLNVTQKSDLAMILQPPLGPLLEKLGRQDPTHLVDAVVDLLLSDVASATMQEMFAGPSGHTVARREDPVAETEDQILSPDAQKSLALLMRLQGSFSVKQHAAFNHTWHYLATEVSSRPVATLDIAQKNDLAMSLELRVTAWLKELGHPDETQLVEAVMHLLLAGDGALAARGMFAGASAKPPAALSGQLDAEVTHRIPTPGSDAAKLSIRGHEGLSLEAFPFDPQNSLGRLAVHEKGTAVQSMLVNPNPGPYVVPPEQPDQGANSYLRSPALSAESAAFEPVRQRVSEEETQAAIDPSLAAFRDWQQGRLDIFTLTIMLPDLWQWINWWLLHDPQRINQDCSLMLEAIETRMQRVEDPIRFIKSVLVSLKDGGVLDLDAMSRQAGPAHDDEHAMPPAPIASPVPPVQTLSFADQKAHLADMNSAQLHHLIRAKIQQRGIGPSLFLDAIEAHAWRSASVPVFFREVLQRLISDQAVDLEQLLADTDYQPPLSGADDAAAPVREQTLAQPSASALPEQLRQALPQRLANAMLQADLASLEIIWPEITRAHVTELAAAAQRYLGRADLRAGLIAHSGTEMLQDLLAALSPTAAQLLAPILRHSAQYCAMLPARLSVHEFEQRLLRYAYGQALKPDVSPAEWLHALMSSVQEMNQDQRLQLEHAWYEVLRATKLPASLLTVLEQRLFEPRMGHRGAAEPAASLLLMRQAELGAAERASLASLLKNIGNETDGALESALSDPQAQDRLTSISPSPVLARLFAMLKPTLAAQLPALLRQIQKALPISLAPVPATLDRRIWRAIYQAAYADGPDDFLPAMVTRLSSQYRQTDPSDWLEKIAGVTTPTPTSTPDQALAGLLQPWGEQKADAPPRKPTPAKRAAEEVQPLSGASNIHNAGMMIIAPYIQRLFNLLDLTVDGKFVGDDAAQRGVHLLQYAVTGEESTPEYQLVLNKLLCGIHGGVPIAAGISISDKEKTTIEQMLTGVITHWSALGSTSIAGLRETFLQRQGHLYFQEDAWQLKIPTKTFDMLLDRLPWSFAMTKMPWMAQPLHVTWR